MVVFLQVGKKLHGLEEVASIGKPEGEAIPARLTDGYAVGVGIQIPQIGIGLFSFDRVAVDGHGTLTPLGRAFRRFPGLLPNRLRSSVTVSGFAGGEVDRLRALRKDKESVPGIRRQCGKSLPVGERGLVTKIKPRVEEIAAMLDLSDTLHRRASGLTADGKQKISLGRESRPGCSAARPETPG